MLELSEYSVFEMERGKLRSISPEKRRHPVAILADLPTPDEKVEIVLLGFPKGFSGLVREKGSSCTLSI
jgi:hypothetical protein